MAIFRGTRGSDRFIGTPRNDIFKLSQGGVDKAYGRGGDDNFLLGRFFTKKDVIKGSGGDDVLNLNGSYAAGVNFSKTTMVGVEKIIVAAGHDYKLTTHDATVALAATLTIDGSLLGSANTLTFDGGLETNGQFVILSGAGNDVFMGGAQGDSFDLSHGGNDSANGGAGDDTFTLGAALTAADQINGGNGSGDVVMLDGDYSTIATKVTFGATTMLDVEKIILAAGNDYKLTSTNATVASGQTLTIDASALGSADFITFDGSAETDGKFTFKGGAGDDSITIGSAAVLAASSIDGGADVTFFRDTVTLAGDFSAGVTLSPANLTNIETLILAAGNDYKLTSTNATVASGQTLTIDASTLGSADFITFDGSAETDGKFTFKGGAGDDSITIGSAAVLAASSIDGGADVTFFRDTVTLAGDFSAGVTLSPANLTNIETLKFGPGHDYNLTAADGLVPTGKQLDVRGDVGLGFGTGPFGPGLGVGDSLSFDGSAETHGSFYLHGGQGDDTLIGGSQNDLFDISHGGSDVATGGIGNEVFFAGATGWDATDQLNGGTGFDYIYSETSANVNITFGANSLIGIEEISVSEHFDLGSFTFVMNDANVASGQSMFIHGFLGAANALSVDGSAETNGQYTITGGGGNDTLIGGALGDTLNGAGGTDTLTGGGGGDSLTGGTGGDSFVFSAASQSTSTTRDTITDLDASADKIDLSVAVSAFDGTVNASVSTASFDANLAAAVDSIIGANEACLLHANAGDLANRDFLVIDGNGSGNYEAGSDFVIDITNFSGAITAGLFI